MTVSWAPAGVSDNRLGSAALVDEHPDLRQPSAVAVLALVEDAVALADLRACVVGVVGALPERIGDDGVVVLDGDRALVLVGR